MSSVPAARIAGWSRSQLLRQRSNEVSTTSRHIRHREEGLRYVYSPTTTPAAARRKALQQHLRVFFGGSPREMATALLRHEMWSDDELDALSQEIEQIRKERKES